MEQSEALAALSALGQSGRLDVFRRLVRAGTEGMRAGALARDLGLRPNTLSASLSVLRAAGLVHSTREGRGIRYHADLGGMRRLLGFLMEDCCGGRPELCRPVIEDLVHAEGDAP